MCEPAEDLYAVLGASPSDSVQQLRHRYQQLALQYHPDRLVGESPSETKSSLQRFLQVDAAWRILSDPDSRRQYDLQRRAQELKQDWPEDSTVFLEDMSWDPGERLYTHCCRCGGAFLVSQEEVEEEQPEEGQRAGLLVCCDTCSLSIHVTWLSHSQPFRDSPD
ncbi:dnaJ homolog subfamily C member 24 [Salarias fasciatus]|uniref:DnaJ homolog subfamily C member 24 n=1 Tax=Salarias fasciatus TaxID=181472 RepID=A0A672FSB1_SALFA|nr:dnaJ homolog subfamily C member 24 [Salarias fasciatus]